MHRAASVKKGSPPEFAARCTNCGYQSFSANVAVSSFPEWPIVESYRPKAWFASRCCLPLVWFCPRSFGCDNGDRAENRILDVLNKCGPLLFGLAFCLTTPSWAEEPAWIQAAKWARKNDGIGVSVRLGIDAGHSPTAVEAFFEEGFKNQYNFNENAFVESSDRQGRRYPISSKRPLLNLCHSILPPPQNI